MSEVFSALLDLFLPDLAQYVRNSKIERQKIFEAERYLTDYLQRAQREVYYNDLDKALHRSKVLSSVINGQEYSLNERIEEVIARTSVSDGNKSAVRNSLNTIITTIHGILDEGTKITESVLTGVEKISNRSREQLIKDIQNAIHEELVRSEGVRGKEDHELDRSEEAIIRHLKAQKRMIRESVLLPIMSNELTFENYFPKLFVKPSLSDGSVEISDLSTLLGQNIFLVGVAGSGKSTLLRYLTVFYKATVPIILLTADNLSLLDELEKQSNRYIVFIDGIDEAFSNDRRGFKHLVQRIRRIMNCSFWLAGRREFVERYYDSDVSMKAYELKPWGEKEFDLFIRAWDGDERAKRRIMEWRSNSRAVYDMTTNPFQLTLLVYLAMNQENPVNNIYDLYGQFFYYWQKREVNRGTGSNELPINVLRDAAIAIYEGKTYRLRDIDNSILTGMLIIYPPHDFGEGFCVKAFKHRSLAAFIIAQYTVASIENSDFDALRRLYKINRKDDVTNFTNRKMESLDTDGRKIWYNSLVKFFNTLSDDEIRIKEKVIYNITRMEIDFSNFILPIIREDPSDSYLRLSLAYGCVLSDNAEARNYALSYAKSISDESEDARVNRGWTLVYFEDVEENLYSYRDDDKKPWRNARRARIRRFTKENPRKKDYRYWIFDLPLFHSFLKSRQWSDISVEEYEILRGLVFLPDRFDENERVFLKREKRKLLKNYRRHLSAGSIS